jgi:hypothetical protein
MMPARIEAPTALIRKKSGEPVKSSLKMRKPVEHGQLAVLIPAFTTKSEPATPTHLKSVHFGEQLEQVKLFIAQQKPSAVSRDGSPTYDTSGTEDSDWPSAIFGITPTDTRTLQMQVTNMPLSVRHWEDIALEEFTLSDDGTCANGRIRVRNIAFEKWVAVRFTFDEWQTTSEMTAKYFDSVDDGTFDRFTFSIRLSDIMSRIEEKTLFLAIRYTTAGREIWDNNHGQNYKAKFTKRQPSKRTLSKKQSFSDEEVADLKGKLEEVARNNNVNAAEEASDDSPLPTNISAQDRFSFKSDPLRARYDFAASAKAPWQPDSPARSMQVPVRPRFRQGRAMTQPDYFKVGWGSGTPNPARRALADVFGHKAPGSPRECDEDFVRPPLPLDDDDDDERPFRLPVRRGSQRGYFDLTPTQASFSPTPSPGMTPRASTFAVNITPTIPRFNSFPQTASDRPSPCATPATTPDVSGGVACPVPKSALLRPGWSAALMLPRGGGSEESTPSITSEEGESSRENSPTPSPTMASPFVVPQAPAPIEQSSVDPTYVNFIQQ